MHSLEKSKNYWRVYWRSIIREAWKKESTTVSSEKTTCTAKGDYRRTRCQIQSHNYRMYMSHPQELATKSNFYNVGGKECTGVQCMWCLLGASAISTQYEYGCADVSDYCEQLILSLSAWKRAASNIQRAQDRVKERYDKKTHVSNFKLGDWV